MTQAIRNNDNRSMLHMAVEMSAAQWKLGFSDGGTRLSEKTVKAWDWPALAEAVEKAKNRFMLAPDCRVVSCYEAGRDGFWPHRCLEARGIDNVVVDAASIDVERRARRKKTDRVDLQKLNQNLVRHHQGERDVWSVVRIPSENDEDARRGHRELQRLKKERTAHKVRIQELLLLQGVRMPIGVHLKEDLQQVRRSDGTPLPRALEAELQREADRLRLVEQQIGQIKAERKERLTVPKQKSDQAVLDLVSLRGLGASGAWILVYELFAWRVYQNRREVAASVGLTPTPYQSGASDREQGISKAGNRRVRALMVELAWGWLRYQPESALSQWFETKFGHGAKRLRRVGIVALARRLLVALWRYLEHGVVPEGAAFKTPKQLAASLQRAA